MLRANNKNIIPALFLTVFSACALGSVFVPVSAVLSAMLAVMLFTACKRNNAFYLSKSPVALFLPVLTLCSLATVLWGADKYYSLLGFVKFLPVLLFGLYAMQLESEDRRAVLDITAPLGALMTVVSFVLSRFEATADYFSVSGRISGFFEYPNSFALFLIVGLITVADREKLKAFDVIISAVLIAGVYLTGSRTSFVLLALTVIALVFMSKNKGFRLAALCLFAAGIAAGVIYFAVTGRHGALARFMTISSSSGTLLGRLLYFKDAAGVIIKHPFGIGYMGYYFTQGSFQTGVYANQYVHNELLQLMLDFGWLPAAAGIASVVFSLLSKSVLPAQKLIILVILAHSMMDFDLQYLIIVFILILCLDLDRSRQKTDIAPAVRIIAGVLLSAALVLSFYLSLSDALYLASDSKRAARVCRYNTMAQLDELKASDDAGKKAQTADIILKNNKHISNAYSAKALEYYAQGDIEKTIEYKLRAIECNRYFIDEYADYGVMLVNTAAYYSEAGDYGSASYCTDRLMELDGMLTELEESTDPIAYKLQDKPDFELPKELESAIDEIRQNNY